MEGHRRALKQISAQIVLNAAVPIGDLWNLLPVCVGDDIKQLFDTPAPDRRNDPKLSAMGSDRVNHRGLLSNKQMLRAMKHQTTLLFWCLGWHKPHVGPADRLASPG
jgi:hypothetical protein